MGVGGWVVVCLGWSRRVCGCGYVRVGVGGCV